jgi:hypothetical protein
MNDQEIEKAIHDYLDQYVANLPDGLEVVLSAITQHFLFHAEDSKQAQEAFRKMACDIINTTEI